MRKILIVGHARHGKDTVAEELCKRLGLRYRGSSEVCAEFIFEELRYTHGYETVQECFEDRGNCRAAWHSLIKRYCTPDKSKLGSLIFSDNDIYCGIRDKEEFDAVMAKHNPIVIWVDALDRLPDEPIESMNLRNCDLPANHLYVNNSGDEAELFSWALPKLMAELRQLKWHSRMADVAKLAASWSKDPTCKVGAVVVAPDQRSFSTGYNGFPRGVEDRQDWLEDKEFKNLVGVHAEVNAILNHRGSVEGWTLYSTKPVCTQCAAAAIQAGIVEIWQPGIMCDSSWSYNNMLALEMLGMSKIPVFQLRDLILNQSE